MTPPALTLKLTIRPPFRARLEELAALAGMRPEKYVEDIVEGWVIDRRPGR